MASLTVRNLPDDLKRKLVLRAKRHGRSTEEEARVILRQAVEPTAKRKNLANAMHELFADIGGADDVPLVPRDDAPIPPDIPE